MKNNNLLLLTKNNSFISKLIVLCFCILFGSNMIQAQSGVIIYNQNFEASTGTTENIFNTSVVWPFVPLASGTNTGVVDGLIPNGVVFGTNTYPEGPDPANPFASGGQNNNEGNFFWGADDTNGAASLQNTTLSLNEVSGLGMLRDIEVVVDLGATGNVIGGNYNGPGSNDNLRFDLTVNGSQISGTEVTGSGSHSYWAIDPNVNAPCCNVRKATTTLNTSAGTYQTYTPTSGDGWKSIMKNRIVMNLPNTMNVQDLSMTATSTADANEYFVVDNFRLYGECKEFVISNIETDPVCPDDNMVTVRFTILGSDGLSIPMSPDVETRVYFGNTSYLITNVVNDVAELQITKKTSSNSYSIWKTEMTSPNHNLTCSSVQNMSFSTTVSPNPVATVVDGCGSSTLTVTNYSGTDVTWTTPSGGTVVGNPIQVTEPGVYSPMIGNCSSSTTVTAAPDPLPLNAYLSNTITPQTYTFNLSDSGYPGWGFNRIFLRDKDGNDIEEFVLTSGQTEKTVTVDIPPGEYDLQLYAVAGGKNEMGIEIIGPDGTQLDNFPPGFTNNYGATDIIATYNVNWGAEICIGDPLELTEIAGSANSWSWSGPNGFSSSSQSPTVPTSQLPTTETTETYMLTAMMGSACTASQSIDVTFVDCVEPCLLDITGADVTNSICSTIGSGEISLEFSGGTAPYTYTLDGGASTAAVSPILLTDLFAGTYTIAITDSNPDGCTKDTMITIIDAGSTFECGDNDGDGVINIVDLDDDNDGIPDLEEGCADGIIYLEDFENASTALNYDSHPNYQPGAFLNGELRDDNEPSQPGVKMLQFYTTKSSSPRDLFAEEVWSNPNPISVELGTSHTVKFFAKDLATNNSNKARFELLINGTVVAGPVTLNTGGWQEISAVWVADAATLDISIKNLQPKQSGNDFSLDNITVISSACEPADTDEDGVINAFDLDSDGDGCPDMVEAGYDLSVLTGYTLGDDEIDFTQNPLGANGYANVLESGESGIMNYPFAMTDGTPSFITLGDCVEICCNGIDDDLDGDTDEDCGIDTDLDGVQDVCDEDIDNDGIPNSVECAATVNIASTGTATSSSNYGPTYLPSNAVNGNTTSIFHSGGGSATEYWQLDLGTSTAIEELLLYNRQDCCPERLSNAWLFITDTPANTNVAFNNSMANYSSQFGDMSSALSLPIDLPAGTQGRYIIIQKAGGGQNLAGNFLHIGDLEVYACTDSDSDGIPDYLDLDSDDDNCFDALEAGHGQPIDATGKVTGVVGTNGLADAVEFPADSGNLIYTPSSDYTDENTFAACGCPTDITSTEIEGCSGETLASAATPAGGIWTITSTIGSTINPTTGEITLGTNTTASDVMEVVTYTASGCADTQMITIFSAPTATATNDGPVCEGTAINLTSSGGDTYAWSGPAGYTNATQNPTLSPTSVAMSGTYTVVVTDANGCTASETTEVMVNEAPTATAIPTAPSCNGGSDGSYNIAVTGGSGPYSYSDGTNTGNNQAPSITVSNVSAGSYTVTVTDAKGCMTTTSVTLLEPSPSFVSAAVTDPVCSGDLGMLVLTGTNLASPFVYNYTGEATDNGSGNMITDLAPGTYNITVTGSNGNGCTATTTATVATPATVTASVMMATNPACNGESTGALSFAVTSGTVDKLTYTKNGGAPVNITGNSISSLGAGNYNITVTDANDCTATIVQTLTEPAAISLTPSSTDASAVGATDGTYGITIAGGTSPYDYDDGTNDGTGVTAVSETGLAAGTYMVTVTDAAGCTAVENISVGQPGCMGFVANATPIAPTCSGGSDGGATLTVANATGAINYMYSGTATGSGSGTSITGLAAGSYSINITDAAGCMTTTSLIITDPAAITATATVTDPACAGDATGSVALTVSSGAVDSYAYDGDGTGSGSGATIMALAAGTYNITVTDANNCTAVESGVVVTDPEAVTSMAGDDQNVCDLMATLDATPPTVGIGVWSQTAGPGTSTYSDNNSPTSTVIPNMAGTYEYTWTVTKPGCPPVTDVVEIIFEALPMADAGPDQVGATEVCGIVGTMAATGTGTWSVVSGPGTVNFTPDAMTAAATATATEDGSYVLRWTVTGTVCPAATDDVAVDFTECDADGDGVLNDVDQDDDNDGISDADEDAAAGGEDIDGDGIPNREDRDSDNDGITDAQEAYVGNGAVDDNDNDGILNNNGGGMITVDLVTGLLNTTYMVPVDTDLDGFPNAYDLDSDADGLPDTFEGNFQVTDADNDGLVGTGIASDIDMDGLADTNDPDFPGNILGGFGFLQDRDNDGIPNHLDIDIDNDGIVDNIEGQPTFMYNDPLGVDANMNGLDDQYDVAVGGIAIGYTNSDGGSAPDYADVASDEENGVDYDILENHVANGAGEPVNAMGMLDITGGMNDADGDGLADIFDLEPGGFGAGAQSGTNATNGQTPFLQPGPAGGERDWRDTGDNDNDGIPDLVDTDDDNDGIPDNVECPLGIDIDSDGDGSPDCKDLDSDGDGIPDVIEAGGSDPDGDGLPGTTTVGTPTSVDPMGGTEPGAPLDGGTPVVLTPIDTDGDEIPDYLDVDSDNDGITDAVEAGGTDPNGDGIQGAGMENDNDSDGLADSVDPIDNRDFSADSGTPLLIPNTDGITGPDYLDLDSDDDGILDVVEAGIDDPDMNGLAGSGIGNTVPDADGDGLIDQVDPIDDVNAGPGPGTKPTIADTDNDGYPNFQDIDSDDDGIIDNVEAQLTAAAPLLVASGMDADMDGIDDVFDTGNTIWGGVQGLDPVSTDPATDPDYINTDSDSDGKDDVEESGLGTPSGADANMDGLDDAFPTTQAFADLNNNDLPGTPEVDFREEGKDTDGDGVNDDDDMCPNSLAGATVDPLTGCTDVDMDGFFPDADPADATFDPDDNEACIPSPTAPNCTPVDADMDGYAENFPSDDPLFDPDDTMPCIPDNTVVACDTDGDLVPDGVDACPFSAVGATVDANGCTDDDMDGFYPDADPMDETAYDPDDMMPCVPNDMAATCDTDNDGVPDGADSCPFSLSGATVNAAGCTDVDGDGYFPDLDPMNSSFDPDDTEACIPEPSELLCVPVDADMDGYFDNYPTDHPQYDPDDTMPCIPDNTVAQCDTDMDGVPDGNDLCNSTAAGVMVNTDGCADEDMDGFFPYDDTNNPAYDPDDAMPCIPDNTVAACDADMDGVPDGNDACPNSVAGASVDANGCTDFDGDGFFPDAPMGPAFDPDDTMVCIPDDTNAQCDTDGDGVPDGMDNCPNSPAGANVAMGFDPTTGCIDADGDGFFLDADPMDASFDPEDDIACVPSATSVTCTPIDADGDGFFENVPTTDGTYDIDDTDPCIPDASNGACDTDGDGVADADDLCPNSATGASLLAGFNPLTGCTDADGDGFFPDADPAEASYDPEDDNVCIPLSVDTDGDGFCDFEEDNVLNSDDDDPCDPDPSKGACDTDMDGVPDAMDFCPNSAAGAVVDARGCTDVDNDGHYPDAPLTSAQYDPEDDNPCVPTISPLCLGVDADMDGYFENYPMDNALADPDDTDPCNPDDSAGPCDTDMDGIPDGDDACPQTPMGNMVDANGCSDIDGDGFYPGALPNTPNYDPQDDNGCVPDANSLTCDNDGDGVADVNDACPNTLPGEVVNGFGCTDIDADGYYPDADPADASYDPNDMEPCVPEVSTTTCTPIDLDMDGYFENYPMDHPLFDPNDFEPCIPDATTLACDGDQDGVPNNDDLCPNSVAGAMVNGDGCTDVDMDGFYPDADPADVLTFDPDDNTACDPDPSLAGPMDDCDGDGNPLDTDPNPEEPTAEDDADFATVGTPQVIMILDNDDFLPSADISITDTGNGNGSGTSVFDPLTGSLSYTPDPMDAGMTVTVEYEVCYTPTTTCDIATVEIVVPLCPTTEDSDMDGLTDCEETTGADDPSTPAVPVAVSNPDDPCDPDPTAIANGDCDFDGNPNGSDPNPAMPVAGDDAFMAVTGQPTEVNILANDDHIPGATITIEDAETGTAQGVVAFNSMTGTITYTPTDTEGGTTVNVFYQVCDNQEEGCAQAEITITVEAGCPNSIDTDMDGLTDCEETTGVDDPNTTAVPNGMSDETNPCDPDPTNGACDADMDGVFADVDPDDSDACIPNPTHPNCMDADGDGVADDMDNCPNTPMGAVVNADGCEDADMDGYSPEYASGSPLFDPMDNDPCIPDGAAAGCDDNDGDGVPNADDLCPGTVAGANVNADGCEDEDMDGYSPQYAVDHVSYDPEDDNPCLPDPSVSVCALDLDGDGYTTNGDGLGLDPNDNDPCDPDPNSDACPQDVDLFPNFTFGNTSFTVGDEEMVVININEILGAETVGEVRFFVPFSQGFTYEFDGQQATADVAGSLENVNNSNWTVTDTGTGLLFSSMDVIAGSDRSRIALKVTADQAGTEANLTVNIEPMAGTEVKETNNVSILSMSIIH